MVLNCDKDRFALQNIKAYYHKMIQLWKYSTEQALETDQ